MDKDKTVEYLQAIVDTYEKQNEPIVSMPIREIDIEAIKHAIELLH